MRFKSVLFDLDGTLLDTLGDLADAMNDVLRQRGFPAHETAAYRYFVGGGATALVQRTLPAGEWPETLIRECVSEFLDKYMSNWNVKTRPYPGITEMLDGITARGARMAVFSNKPDNFVQLNVNEYLGAWDFAAVIGPKEGVPVKPDPTGAFLVARALNAEPRDVLYVGDTSTDMRTAANAGMFPLGVLWGFRPESELLEHGAAATISHPIELLEFVAEG